MKKRKATADRSGENVMDYRQRTSKRLNIPPAGKRKLEPEEMKRLQEAFRNHEPWLEWAGKREQQWCVADPEHEHREAVQFYKHPMD